VTDSPVSDFASIEEIVEEASNGRMFILMDDEDRENEGDLVIPAQMATPDAINFMAMYGRGLICLALADERIAQLGLPPMASKNGDARQTAFTVSIEARSGVTTGISAADRARTIAVAIDAALGPEHLISPGHVFPLVARKGGVLVRAGHTEAAVDIARLAGLNPSGVICEIIGDDGKMARRKELVAFARRHDLKIATIADLIAYRRRHDNLIQAVTEAQLNSEFGGKWLVRIFANSAEGGEHVVLQKGIVDPAVPTLVRMHNLSLYADMLGEISPASWQLPESMKAIAKHGSGVIVILRDTVIDVLSRQLNSRKAGDDGNFRDYGIGAQILAELGVRDIILLTNTNHNYIGLSGYDLSIVEQRPLGLPKLAAAAHG
jgi:3,4-dihydroxy 2-butanone 4-phosphate synthase/GTP cyclohydrolase II